MSGNPSGIGHARRNPRLAAGLRLSDRGESRGESRAGAGPAAAQPLGDRRFRRAAGHLHAASGPRGSLRELVPHVVFHGGVSDEKYADILADNAVMVSASKSEGFGLPLIEAIKMGIPAVVSDMDIFQEVGGNGALYFNDAKSFAKQIESLDNDRKRKSLVKKGQKHIQKFDWDKSATELIEAMSRLTDV